MAGVEREGHRDPRDEYDVTARQRRIRWRGEEGVGKRSGGWTQAGDQHSRGVAAQSAYGDHDPENECSAPVAGRHPGDQRDHDGETDLPGTGAEFVDDERDIRSRNRVNQAQRTINTQS